MLFLIIVVAIILILVHRIKIRIDVQQNEACVSVTFLFVITLRRKYVVEREKGALFALYQIKKSGRKKTITLSKAFRRSRKTKLAPKQKQAIKKALSFVVKSAKVLVDAKLVIGAGDAAATAMLCGALGAVSAATSAMIGDDRHTLRVRIRPLFAKRIFSIDAVGIMKLSLANIILGYILYKKSNRR